MANPKITIEQKKATGSYRPGAHGTEDPPQGVPGRPPIPDCLHDRPDALKIFEATCDFLEDADWLRVSDGASIHSYSILQARLNRDPDEFTAAEFTQLRLFINELGLSPASRARMPGKKSNEKPDNPFGGLDGN